MRRGGSLGLPQTPLSPLSSLSEPSPLLLTQAPLRPCSLTPAPPHTLSPCPFHSGSPQHPSGPTPSPHPPPVPLRAEPPAPWPRCHGYGGRGGGEGKCAGGTGNARPHGAQRAPRRAGSECAFPVRAARGSASLPAAVAAAMKDVPGFLQQSQSAGPGQAAVWHRLEELYNKK